MRKINLIYHPKQQKQQKEQKVRKPRNVNRVKYISIGSYSLILTSTLCKIYDKTSKIWVKVKENDYFEKNGILIIKNYCDLGTGNERPDKAEFFQCKNSDDAKKFFSLINTKSIRPPVIHKRICFMTEEQEFLDAKQKNEMELDIDVDKNIEIVGEEVKEVKEVKEVTLKITEEDVITI